MKVQRSREGIINRVRKLFHREITSFFVDEEKKGGGGCELVVQSLPRLPHPRKTPRDGISCYLMPAKLSSKISLTTPDLLKTLSPPKAIV